MIVWDRFVSFTKNDSINECIPKSQVGTLLQLASILTLKFDSSIDLYIGMKAKPQTHINTPLKIYVEVNTDLYAK